jgi:hypothetical protein
VIKRNMFGEGSLEWLRVRTNISRISTEFPLLVLRHRADPIPTSSQNPGPRWGSLTRSYRPSPRTNLRTTSLMIQLTKLLRAPRSQLTLKAIPTRLSYHTKLSIMSFETTGTIASFGGKLLKLKHKSASTNTDMELNLFMPPQAAKSGAKIPVLFYLSGLTCTGNNCSEKGFFQHGAAKHGIAVVYPDTSPSMWSHRVDCRVPS